MRAHLALLIPADNALANDCPEGFGVAKMPAQGVPFQVRILGTQRSESCLSEATPLVLLDCVWLLNPSKAAPTAGLVIDSEGLVAVEIRSTLTPTSAFPGYRVLPGRTQDRHTRPARTPAQATS
jgi:hypothetical protein